MENKDLLQLGDMTISDFADAEELIQQALNYGDTLATPKESQVLVNLTGVSINAKPRKDGRYQGYVLCEGEKKYLYGKTRDEVATKIKLYLKEGQKPKKKQRETKSPLFGDYTEKWIEIYKKPNLKPTTLSGLRATIKPALAAFGERSMSSITSDELQSLLLNMKAERARDLCFTYLNQIFKKAEFQGIVKKNPCDAVEIKKHRSRHKNALTIEEQTAFIEFVSDTKYSLLFRVLLATGMRIGEALALTKCDVDFVKHSVTVSKNVVFIKGERIAQDTPKTEAGNRTIPLPKSLCEELIDINADLLFPFSYNAVNHAMQLIAKQSGVTVSAHILRHTYATRLEEAGIPPKIKQYLLGHASLEMTQNIYTDAQSAYVDSVSERVRNLF